MQVTSCAVTSCDLRTSQDLIIIFPSQTSSKMLCCFNRSNKQSSPCAIKTAIAYNHCFAKQKGLVHMLETTAIYTEGALQVLVVLCLMLV